MTDKLQEAISIIEGMVRLSDMGLEQSMLEPEENGNYSAYERAKRFLEQQSRETLVARLREYGSRPADESSRGFISTYIELCRQAADTLEGVEVKQALAPSEIEVAVGDIIELVQKGEDELSRGATDLAFDAFIDIKRIAKTIGGECHGCHIWQATAGDEAARGNEYEVEVRDLKAKNAQLIEALSNVRALIAEGAAFGFNHTLGDDWADRLFHSQQMTSTALKANGVPTSSIARY